MPYPKHPVDSHDLVPVPAVPASSLQRYRGAILDPRRATTSEGRRPNPTAYVTDQLLVSGSGDADALGALLAAAGETGNEVGPSPESRAKRDSYVDALGREALRELAARTWVTRMNLRPRSGADVRPDAWQVLQKYRELGGSNEVRVGLNHLVHLTGGVGISGVPYISGPALEGSPYISGPGFSATPYISGPGVDALSPYISGPGVGARLPVTWLGAPPRPRSTRSTERRPVVAVLDTGLGKNDWLQAPDAILGASVLGHSIGLGEDVPDAEVTGAVQDPRLGLLDRDAGHGTFIAGIIRQTCPEAVVLAIRVMPSDGVVDEHQLAIALNKLLIRQAHAQAPDGPQDEVIDVLSLSLGFYLEDTEDVAFNGVLAETLRSFAERGVSVVAAAGNDHTTTPMYPAGFASRSKGTDQPREVVPLVSVGALNPSGSIAIFSNTGPWVSCYRPGANVVSTVPTTFDGSAQPAVVTKDGGESLDPDDYTGGFGVWSGTSFAAPVLAGEIASSLVDQGNLQDTSSREMVSRGRKAIQATVDWNLE
jgi:subtilisin family serine protease